MKWLSALILSAALLSAPSAASAAPSKPLPACTPAQRASWPITDRNTVIEGRTILIHTEPGTGRRCGEVKRNERTPRQTAPKKVRK